MFSGKKHPRPGTKAVFFCYALPGRELQGEEGGDREETGWSEEAGYTAWYMYSLNEDRISDEPTEMFELIQSAPDTPRHRGIHNKTLSEIRGNIEKHIKNTYLKKVQAPVGVTAKLKAWMELS